MPGAALLDWSLFCANLTYILPRVLFRVYFNFVVLPNSNVKPRPGDPVEMKYNVITVLVTVLQIALMYK